MQSGGWRNPTPGRGPGSLQLRRAAGAGCSGAQVGGAARGAPARVVGWEPERKGALQPREPPPPPTGERETAGSARGHPQPGVAAARTPGSGRRARMIGQVGKVALGSTVGFLGGKWRQPGSAGKILTPAFATGLTRSVLSSNPGTVPPPLFRPPARLMCPCVPNPVIPGTLHIHAIHLRQLPSSGLQLVRALCIDSPNSQLRPPS